VNLSHNLVRLGTGAVVCGFGLLAYPEPAHANVIFPPQMLAALTLWVYPLSALIEAVALTFFLRRYFVGNHGLRLSFSVIFLLNLVTLLITNMLGFGLMGLSDSSNTFFLAEIFPLVSEYYLLTWLFRRWLKQSIMLKPVKPAVVRLLVLVLNAVTFGLGLLLMRWFY
jgi:hypothetical protein